MKKAVLITLLAAVPLVAMGSGVAYAHWGRGQDIARAQRFIQWRVNDTLRELDATDEQTERVNQVVDELVREALPMIREHRRSRGELKAFFFSEDPDPERLHAAIDDRLSELSRFAHRAADAALEVHETLTPEQRAELEELLPKRGRH